ncbi:four helix bundle protein [Echinicola salinicaeni]|uniref:four helix bundle protein n=1 Tax=Echinicola salinicaeni TaxID=2762757 RepID=UPI001645C65D|nr:four helix bundle protein [Echinicola salinicaeni]
MEYVKNFQELNVYITSKQLSQNIFQVSREFPKEETFSLTDQVRRSSRSIGAQIAEAWGKRRYERHFISKLTDTDAEQLETQHWIETASNCGYISEDKSKELLNTCRSIGKMLNGMMAKSSAFCGKTPVSDK